MEASDFFEIIIVVGVLLLIIRNFRKDRSDGRDPLGGGGGRDPNRPPTRQK